MRTYFIFALMPVAAALATASVAIFAWQRREIPGARTFGFFSSSLFIWCFFSVFEYLSQDEFGRILFGKLQYFGITTFAVFWLAFTLQYTHHDGWLTRRNWFLSLILPGLSLLFGLLAPRLALIWRSVELVHTPFPTLSIEHGWWFHWVMVPYNYLLFALGIGLLLQALFVNSRLYRQQTLFLLIAGLFPFLFNAVYVVADVTVYGLDLTPISMALSNVMVVFGLFRVRLFELSPIPYRTVFLSIAEAVIVLDRQHRVVDLNPSAQRLCTHPNPLGQPLQWVFPQYTEAVQMTSPQIVEQGAAYHEVKVTPLKSPGGQTVGKILIVGDVTLEQQQWRQLEQDAYLDSLTGIFNRRQFQQRAEQSLSWCAEHGLPAALLYIDLDHFKHINDTQGHAVGDRVLKHVANSLRRSVRKGDLVARIGGDEFVALLPQTQLTEAQKTRDRIAAQLRQPIRAAQPPFQVAASIGIARYPEDGTSLAVLLETADSAMYQQKRHFDNSH